MSYLEKNVLYQTKTNNSPIGSSVITVDVPDGQAWEINTIEVTRGGNTTITKIEIDGIDANITGDTNDMVSLFGDMPLAQTSIKVTVDNAGASAENNTITIKGIQK